jgi:hypothetical protein
MVVQVVVLSANGESRQSRMTAAPSVETVAKLLRKTKKPDAVGVYAFEELQLTVWGWKEGKAGTENKHELPPPLDGVLLFGDAVVSAADADGAPQDFTMEEWETFYDEAFKGFEDTSSSDDEDDAADDVAEDVVEDVAEDIAEEADAEVEEDEAEEEESDVADEEDEGSANEDEDEEEEDANEDCYDDGDDAGGGGKRRAPRRRAIAAPEYRRMEMGLRSRVKLPAPPGKRAPRWQTAPELTEESYDL